MRYIALITLLIGTLVTLGCDEAANRVGGIGQSCQNTNDCGGDLVCLFDVCQYENLPLDPSANVCRECMTDEDCTDEGPQACDDGFCRLSCAVDQDCIDGQAGNACEVSTGDCYSYQCSTDQVTPIPCPAGLVCDDSVGEIANQGVCFDCLTNDDCAEEEACIDRVCATTCSSDQDCEGGFACNASTQFCEFVGCRTDRECAVSSRDYEDQLLVCNEETNLCEYPCTTDAECLYFVGGAAYCLDGACTSLGCTTDDECRIQSGPNSVCVPPPTSSTSSSSSSSSSP